MNPRLRKVTNIALKEFSGLKSKEAAVAHCKNHLTALLEHKCDCYNCTAHPEGPCTQ